MATHLCVRQPKKVRCRNAPYEVVKSSLEGKSHAKTPRSQRKQTSRRVELRDEVMKGTCGRLGSYQIYGIRR